MDHRFEDLFDAAAVLAAGEDGAVAIEPDDLFELALRLVGLRRRQIDLVDDRDDFEVVLDREIRVGQRLRLDALRRVDQQQRAFARGERPGDFVTEIDVARRVDQVEHVGLAVGRGVVQPDRMGLDGDAALALQVHAVEDLGRHLAHLQRAGDLEKAIGQRRFAVVDVGNDGKVAYVRLFHRRFSPLL